MGQHRAEHLTGMITRAVSKQSAVMQMPISRLRSSGRRHCMLAWLTCEATWWCIIAGILLGMMTLCVPAAVHQLATATPAVGSPNLLRRRLPALTDLTEGMAEAALQPLSVMAVAAPAWGVLEALNLIVHGFAAVVSRLAVAVRPSVWGPPAGPFVPPSR